MHQKRHTKTPNRNRYYDLHSVSKCQKPSLRASAFSSPAAPRSGGFGGGSRSFGSASGRSFGDGGGHPGGGGGRGLRIKSTKSGEVRRFPLPSVALAVLSQHRRTQPLTNPKEPNQPDPGLVFCHPEGDYYKPDQLSSKVAEIMAKAGLRAISLHSLRHTHASQLLSEGVPIPTVSKRLGHANPTITLKLYSHALEPDELAAAQRWDDAFADIVEAHANATPS